MKIILIWNVLNKLLHFHVCLRAMHNKLINGGSTFDIHAHIVLFHTVSWTEVDKKDAVKRSLDDKYNKNRSRDEASNTTCLSGSESGEKVKHISIHRCYIWHCRRHVSTLYCTRNHYISVVLFVSFFVREIIILLKTLKRRTLTKVKEKIPKATIFTNRAKHSVWNIPH